MSTLKEISPTSSVWNSRPDSISINQTKETSDQLLPGGLPAETSLTSVSSAVVGTADLERATGNSRGQDRTDFAASNPQPVAAPISAPTPAPVEQPDARPEDSEYSVAAANINSTGTRELGVTAPHPETYHNRPEDPDDAPTIGSSSGN